VQVQLARTGNAAGVPVRLTKGVTLAAGESAFEVAYLLEDLPPDTPLHFAVEFNLAGMPSGVDDRYFHDEAGSSLGQLGTQLDLEDAKFLGLVDQWQGLDVGLTSSRSTGFWTFPIETVSQSEGGFELVHQSIVVMPHWVVLPDQDGKWSVTMRLSLDATAAQTPIDEEAVAFA
jgi:alpha-amylase